MRHLRIYSPVYAALLGIVYLVSIFLAPFAEARRRWAPPVGIVQADIFFQDTASSAGGTGRTSATSGATRAFHDVAEGLAGIKAVNNPVTKPTFLYVSCGSGADTSDVTSAFTTGPTCSGSGSLTIIAVGSSRHAGVWTDVDPCYRLKRTNSKGYYQNVTDKLYLSGLQIEITVTNGSDYEGAKIATANNGPVDAWADGCIVKAVRTSGNVSGLVARYVNGSPTNPQGRAAFRNCLTINCTYGCNCDFPGAEVYNCTFGGGLYGVVADASMTCVNNLVANNAETSWVTGGGTFSGASDYNAESNGSATPPGAHSVSNKTFTFVNSGAGDYRITTGDTWAYHHGAYNPASDGLTLKDGLGATRPNPPSIGFNDP